MEQFLKEDEQFQDTLQSKDVLVKFYVAKSKFADAANVLIVRSEQRRPNETNLDKQLDCLTRALIFAQQISVVTRGGQRYGGLKCSVSEIHERIKVWCLCVREREREHNQPFIRRSGDAVIRREVRC